MSDPARRRLLALLLALGGATSPLARAASALAPAGSTSQAATPVAARAGCAQPLADRIDVSVIRDLATQFRANYPQHANDAEVATLLRAPDIADAMSRLRRRMTQDFAADRLVELSGWRVSRTEGLVLLALTEC